MGMLDKIRQFFFEPDDKDFSICYFARGEAITYTDADIKLDLDRTYCNGHRLYCIDTEYHLKEPLPLEKRLQILDNLCKHFRTKKRATIFVLDEADKDRAAIEAHILSLAQEGHKVSIENDSAAIREKFEDEMYLSIVKSKSSLVIDGTEIETEDDYWRWKKSKAKDATY